MSRYGVPLVVVVAITASHTFAEERASQAKLFGVPLGASEDQFWQVIERAGTNATSVSVGTNYPRSDVAISTVNLAGTVNPVPGPANTVVTIAGDQIFEVQVNMDDVSLKGWKRIKASLVDKYGHDESGDMGEEDGGLQYRMRTPTLAITARLYSGERRFVRITYRDLTLERALDRRVRELERIRLGREGKNDSVDFDENL